MTVVDAQLAAGVLASIPARLRDNSALTSLIGRVDGTVAVPEAARALSIAALAELSGRRPVVVACPTSTLAAQLVDDLGALLPPSEVALFPAWETLPFERVSPSVETMGRRLEVLWRLRDEKRTPRVVVASMRALLQQLGPDTVDLDPVIVRKGATLDPDELLRSLVAGGYRREELVEHRGEVAKRGAIIDVFPSTADAPIRIDLWGDEVDRLTTFSVNDQRSEQNLDEAILFPARELILGDDVRARASSLVASEPWGREHWERLSEGLLFDGMESWLPWLTERPVLLSDVLPRGSKMLLLEPRRMRDRATDLLAEEADLARTLAGTWASDPNRDFPRLYQQPDRLLSDTRGSWNLIPVADGPDIAMVEASGWGAIGNSADGLTERIKQLLSDDYRVVVTAESEASARRLAESFANAGLQLDLHVPGTVPDLSGRGGAIVVTTMSRGVTIPSARIAIITEADITGRRTSHRRPRPRKRSGSTIFEDLKPGNYVVHYIHGVAKYEGMTKMTVAGVERDYLVLAYKGTDKLYLPSDQIDAVRHYVGGEAPTLHKLGGGDFAKAKSKVRSAVRAIAQELVVLYQKRVNARGHAFGSDTPWQFEMEQAFPYVETPDQKKAIDETKADMEREFPMDRLVCGDVGFGKTEVAVRAAFKAIQDGKQVAVLVPTTLLASQHGNTFADRFAGYPIRVETLSRFLTNAEANKVIAGLASGEVDCVIGTHRLLSKGITFKNLGLLIVDEEQRFGVQHKEAMKHLKTDVDVLTLTATPIPRTLEMSLVGIRDLSLLQTPPADRQPILTFVGPYDERVAVEAIRRELLREGQVFWVHNRVQSIEECAMRLRELVPEARIAIAHGQMDEGALEQVVMDFWEGNFDVLVCTTIIESGIDMPTVNTLVVERADVLGLGQLHQLRGRVGRSGQRAYAYLFHPRDKSLTEEAYERLKTIGEATDLGSGFKIAMRDLEIRGAGNLLGEAQSGHIAAVGYDLYCQMVTEAVGEMKGEPVREPSEIRLDVPTTANLPKDYIAKEELRLEAYRRLAQVTTPAEVEDIRDEWTDRYGPMPAPAAALLDVALLRAECHRLGLNELSISTSEARIGPIDLKASESIRLRRLAKDAIHKEGARQLVLSIPRGRQPAEFLVGFLRELVDPPAGWTDPRPVAATSL
ncbi:MAG: transcription-repair coupling factor [Actinomycetota bacterium]